MTVKSYIGKKPCWLALLSQAVSDTFFKNSPKTGQTPVMKRIPASGGLLRSSPVQPGTPANGTLTPPAFKPPLPVIPAPDALSGTWLFSTGLAPLTESLFRLFAGPSGVSPSDAVTETDLASLAGLNPFQREPSCCFSQLQGLAVVRSPLPLILRSGLDPLLSLAPSGFCTLPVSVTVTSPCRSCPLLQFLAVLAGTSAVFSTVLRVSVPILRWL